jgi:hypothetical protein
VPLVILVLIVIWIFVSNKESNQKAKRDEVNEAYDLRKTNAKLEQRILDNYMKHGVSFDDAYKKTQDDMVQMGFVPCIPRSGYSKNTDTVQSSKCTNIESYDSGEVQSRRWDIIFHYQKTHTGHPDDLDEQIYKNFPTNRIEQKYYSKVRKFEYSIIPDGEYIVHPQYGTCEILGHSKETALSGTYKVQVLNTGKITTLQIGDKQIQRVTRS